MRIALIAVVAVAAMGGAAYLASKRLVVEQKPVTPPPSFVVEASLPGERPSVLEQQVAVPLEQAVAKVVGVTRVRTRITAGRVQLEVWCPETLDLAAVVNGASAQLPAAVAPPVVRRVDPKLQTYWVVRGDARPKVDGEVCGRGETLVNVRLDPLKLQERHVSALEVDRALVKADAPDKLLQVAVVEGVKLSDVAVVEAAPPKPRCTARTPEGPAWFVSTLQQELGPDATRLEAPVRVELEGPGDLKARPTSAEALVTTFEPPSKTTLWFSPSPPPAGQKALLRELQGLAGARLTHVDWLPRVRLVLTGADRETLGDIASLFSRTVPATKGVEVFVPAPEPVSFIDVKVDKERAAMLGVPEADVRALSALALRGSEHDGVRIAIELDQPEQLGALYLRDKRLGELVILRSELELPLLTRENGQPSIELVAYGIDRKQVPQAALPAGVRLEIHEEM